MVRRDSIDSLVEGGTISDEEPFESDDPLLQCTRPDNSSCFGGCFSALFGHDIVEQRPAPPPGPPGYALHWVIRTTDLKQDLDFFINVCGMKILRHEENAKGCEIQCNGPWMMPWSKTMVGYDTEDRAYVFIFTSKSITFLL